MSTAGVILFTLVIHSYIANQRDVDFPEFLYGIPTYRNSKLSAQMSSLESDPYTAVFLTKDPYEKVLEFYKEKMGVDHRVLRYGRKGFIKEGESARVFHRVYQFKIEDGILTNQISKGVEIIPFNKFNQKVFKAKTKIKIFISQSEIAELKEKANQGYPEDETTEEIPE